MKFTSVFKRTRKAVKERFVNLAKKPETQNFKFDMEHYVHPTSCSICQGIIPNCVCDLLQKVDNGEIPADEILIAYLQKQDTIRNTIVTKEEYATKVLGNAYVQTDKFDSQELMTSSGLNDPVTVSKKQKTATFKNKMHNITAKLWFLITKKSTLSTDVETLTDNASIDRSQPILSLNPEVNAHPPTELVTERREVATTPPTVSSLVVSTEEEDICVDGLEQDRKGHEKTHKAPVLHLSDLCRWQTVTDFVDSQYNWCEEMITGLEECSKVYRLRGFYKARNEAKATAKALFRRLFKCDISQEQVTSSEHLVNNLKLGNSSGFTAAVVKYYTILTSEENTWRQYRHLLGISSNYDNLMRQNIDNNRYEGNTAKGVRREINGVTDQMFNKVILIDKYQKENTTSLVGLGKILEDGHNLTVAIENAKDEVARMRLESEFQLYKSKCLKKIHKELGLMEILSKRHIYEVKRFSEIIEEKTEIYRYMCDIDSRTTFQVTLKENATWMKCLLTKY
ncbi:uncharacterized protein KNAG_0J01380 [Huiozyma naganishii CBS 8797]|uniref:Uncharacterized protein n=1 Tax=Huiozyma naganishii (strain ATCC MYA-139 / BCRC 22969 / CBS 8797 / KCTC 17520 / NBRC 10181 / NCYC 3082 / Yp74L-3) TaxID=1071383 RepID=J7S9P2_HUIN7|nr:hypothetical protein KNAG_0J01380 [Kazachstania naganishii CBS 8797]CCK72219.1 hypothetical protein KNAG_0J01380 [Kazachstania naganishii CBS 8797]